MLKNKKRVCLFIVEGKSDEMALAVPLRNIFKRHQGTQDIRFEITHGDITSKKGLTQDKVIAAVGNAVKDFMRKYKLKKQDFAAVVQIVDTDGTFVGDEHIKIDNQSHYDKYPFYTKDDIVVQTRKGQENLVWRNHIKAKNLEKLSQNSKVMGIPYKVFYFSCNLDHVLYNIENLADDDKVQKAAEFAGKYRDDEHEFLSLFKNVYPVSVPVEFKASWEFIRQEQNSLKRNSNFLIFLDNLVIQSLPI